MIFSTTKLAAITAALTSTVAAQTWTSCNPLHTTCDPNPALGMAIDVDFRKGQVNSFVEAGSPEYGSDGATFTVAASGQAPQLISVFYIMFGRVEITMKAATGAGIVSSLVLQSDTLDEIDFEWLGADPHEVQSNYFGKGQVTDYNRGQFHPMDKNNQEEFLTYIFDWTKDRTEFYVDGVLVRTLTFAEADDNQYPQSPMQVKFGAWSGGDPANAPGTIAWAKGPTNFADGPFHMVVRDVKVTDYSTGKEYVYSDNSGNWQSITAVDGEVNANEGNLDQPRATATAAAADNTGPAPTIPAGGIGTDEATAQQTGWPWDSADRPAAGSVPEGWRMTEEGKLVPIGAGAALRPCLLLLVPFFLGAALLRL
ncbi:family 16 glycosyl hydrolase [Plectosphaerella cucumerina]|uniref:chitinase n=1 Tax=Plectosphaerella cucumerina TaxID=40658 RepID=A0A8K0TPQ4_9PEZI|nr:family 16 glycosyl hydrolase [Plectosphaerella cucumerina]